MQSKTETETEKTKTQVQAQTQASATISPRHLQGLGDRWLLVHLHGGTHGYMVSRLGHAGCWFVLDLFPTNEQSHMEPLTCMSSANL